MTDAIISVRGLSRRFGALAAVDSLDLDVAAGEIVGLVGPDGAGKTTTLRMLCGLVAPTGGGVLVAGYDIAKDIDAVKDRIGYMAQRFGLYQDLTVEENMDFYADLFGVTGAERDGLKASLLRMTRMEPFRGRPAGKLSGGMKQKLALACTLLHHPQILFLDEPTNGVDPVSRRDFWAILYRLVRDGLTVLVTTAYLDEAERCNRVGMMRRGRLVALDTPARLKAGLRETCYRVTGPDLRSARAALAQTPGVASATPSGASLRLLADSRTAGLEALRRAAPGCGFAETEPSLEDVFIARIEAAERAEKEGSRDAA